MSNVYEAITDKIVKQLEAGIIPWRKGWKSTSSGLPLNYITRKPYRGINILTLFMTRFESNQWMTYKQAQSIGANVRRGEHGEQIVFWKFDKKLNADGEEQRWAMARTYTVFNVEQIDGLPVALPFDAVPFDPIVSADAIVQTYMGCGNHPTLAHGGNSAYYRPSQDHVQMPPQTSFLSEREYYSTLFHEFAHSTGHKSRLDRSHTGGFGTEDYSKEELIAEFAACFLCADAGISNDDLITNSTAYIQGWLKVLKNDTKLAMSAAQAAQRAVDIVQCRTFGADASEVEVSA